MFERGLEYHQNPHRGRIDRFIALLLLPAVNLGERYVDHVLHKAGIDLPPVTEHKRIGYRHTVITTGKLTTQDPETGASLKYPGTDKTIRSLEIVRLAGLDELPQVRNIRAREMLFVGCWRPLFAEKERGPDAPPLEVLKQDTPRHTYERTILTLNQSGHADLATDLDNIIDTARPAIFGSHTIFEHTCPPKTPISSVRRVRMCKVDHDRGSAGYNALLLTQHGRIALRIGLQAVTPHCKVNPRNKFLKMV